MKSGRRKLYIHVASQFPDPGVARRDTILVLLHGSWHGAWTWKAFQECFARAGYTSFAPNLRGHGDQSAEGTEARSEGKVTRRTSLDDYARDVAQALAEHLPPEKRFVFIAHSLAGRIVLHYLRRQQREGWPLPAGIVFIAAVPPWGVLPSTARLLFSKTYGSSVWDALSHFEMYRLVNTPKRSHSLFRHATPSVTDEARESFQRRLGDEALWGYIQTTLPSPFLSRQVAMRLRKARVSVLVMGGEDDPIISKSEVEQTARVYGTTECDTFPRASHDLMLDIEERTDIATRLLTWLERLNTTANDVSQHPASPVK